ncbi:MAG TPA: response regulator transcription factor [Methylibium sp.]|uniref:response regulator transcription factor n=1 Tax=Methylibium sp. TaxID=2067992 RepID=UPI002DBA8A82|nr:response regulator transcription factor [Methylibium sp.]HEU4457973.1 response regulator transcription factor [Methylibium sp.]
MHILLAEDDPALAELTMRALRSQGWAVDHTPRGEPVAASVKSDPYDLLVLDIGLAGIDGIETLKRVRAQGSTLPVLMLTARDAIEDRVQGLETGADDYLVKPFALAELIARIKVLTRRHAARQATVLAMGSLRMDREARRAWIGEQPLELSAREWAVLEYLLGRVGHVVGKEQILQAISGWDDALSENAVEVYVSRLRPKIEPAGLRIRAVRGFGYLVEEQGAPVAAG